LRPRTREKAGRDRSPRTAYGDSQSVKAGGSGGATGYDAGKTITGRKRHLVVDSLGLLLAVMVTAASKRDAVATADLIGSLPMALLLRLRRFWADTAYGTVALLAEVAFWGRYLLGIVRRPPGSKGWILLPRRWGVERTLAWLLRFRRHSRDYERETPTSEAMVYVSMISILLHRLAPERTQYRFRYQKTG
jgi:putative transposase